MPSGSGAAFAPINCDYSFSKAARMNPATCGLRSKENKETAEDAELKTVEVLLSASSIPRLPRFLLFRYREVTARAPLVKAYSYNTPSASGEKNFTFNCSASASTTANP